MTAEDVLEKSTYYILDASGNTMSVYERAVDELAESIAFYQAEKHIYGSSRLGIMNDSVSLLGSENSVYDMTLTSHVIGLRNYELNNHLGNVLSTVTDCPMPENTSYYLTLDGVNDNATTAIFNPGITNDFTVGAWIRTTNTTTNQVIASQYDGAADQGFLLSTRTNGKAYIEGRNGNGAYYSFGSSSIVTDGQWHYVAGTRQGTSWKIYIDGVLENTGTSLPGSMATLNQSFQIGSATPSSVNLKGDVREVSYWNTTRTQSQIQTAMNTVFTGSEAGLVGYWPLTDNVSPSADLSSVPHNATLNNGASFASNTVIYRASIVSAQDYSPFGVTLSGRNFSVSEKYRYGFQNQEMDDEIKGEGNSVNFSYRMHDPRLGSFFAVDPLSPKYPHNSPYAFNENSVIACVELEGLEMFFAADGGYLGKIGTDRTIMVVDQKNVLEAYKFIGWANDQSEHGKANFARNTNRAVGLSTVYHLASSKSQANIAKSIYTTYDQKNIQLKSMEVNMSNNGTAASTGKNQNFTIYPQVTWSTDAYEKKTMLPGEFLMDNFYNQLNAWIHEEEHNKLYAGTDPNGGGDDFSHFVINIIATGSWTFSLTTNEYKGFVRVQALHYLVGQTNYLHGLLTNSDDPQKTYNSYNFQFYLQLYNENVEKFCTVYGGKCQGNDFKDTLNKAIQNKK